ncbi:hypothetical protein GCM10027034_11350 [Ramlibacter solisilvae]|uniref:Exo-alpha-sialidase n=1 Tax=Ramlibacter tataouinensis TaxID=94132 RepID=A0A127JXJ8_9BURK|nr:hypothetical protein UC35_19155 [Ramlibacter tataouinensis]
MQVTGDTQLAVNTSYSVNPPGTGTVTLTLPATATVNDTVSITGTSAAPWTVAQNANQTILTTGLNGNAAPGTAWTLRPFTPPRVWHWVSSDATGEVLLAGEANATALNGALDTSRNGGQTWSSGNSTSAIWISSDMTATGSRMVAVQYGGGMFTSSDLGATWTRLTHALVNNAAGLNFESVTMSADGQRLAAVIQPTPTGPTPTGRLQFSNDGGATWTAATLPAGTYWWRGVDSSADGQVIMAVAHTSEIFLSTNAGATWVARPVILTGTTTPVLESWYRVKMSADGNTIAVAANSFGTGPGSGIFVSRDRGASWTRSFTQTADYTAIAMSSDGKSIAASMSDRTVGTTTTPGRVVMSTDSGATFAPLTMPAGATNWRTIAMSADGAKLAAATGLFFPATPGQLYTSQGNRTSVGTGGGITGHQNDSVTLQFLGNGQWSVQSNTGGPFTIR